MVTGGTDNTGAIPALAVACRVCKAAAGEPCKPRGIRRGDRHSTRAQDAALVAHAARPTLGAIRRRPSDDGIDIRSILESGGAFNDTTSAPTQSGGLVVPANGQAPSVVKLTPASSITIDRPRWTWQNRIPVGGTTLMPGREGLGKTALVCYLSARLSRGDLHGERFGRPCDIIYIGQEDDRATVTVPRLKAAGADLDRFLFVDLPEGRPFSIGVDIDELAVAARGLDVGLIVLDPLDSHLGASVDSHRKAEVQAAIARLAQLAQRLRCGALGLAHLNKGDVRDLLGKVVGSVGFTTSVRSVLGVGEHPQNKDERVCVVGKANMTDRSSVPAVRFRIEKAMVPHPTEPKPIETARIVLLGEQYGIDPNAIILANAEDRSAIEEAVEWLRDVLSDGPQPRAALVKLARPEGITEMTLKRAAKRLGVVSERDPKAQGRPASWHLSGVSDQGVLCQEGVNRNMNASDRHKQPENQGFGSSPRVEPKPEEIDPSEPF